MRTGVRFVVASGNQSWQLRSFFEPTDAVAFAAENGHFVYDTGRETPLSAVEPDPALGRALVGTLEDLRHPYLVSSVEGACMPPGSGTPTRPGRGCTTRA